MTCRAAASGIGAYFLWLAPSAEELAGPWPSAIDDPSLDRLAINAAHLPGDEALLVREDGNFLVFNFYLGNQIEPVNYGILLKTSEYSLTPIWLGLTVPTCTSIEKYDVPAVLVPYCEDTIEVDRSNLVREIFSIIQAF
jgi:hypothetical protein